MKKLICYLIVLLMSFGFFGYTDNTDKPKTESVKIVDINNLTIPQSKLSLQFNSQVAKLESMQAPVPPAMDVLPSSGTTVFIPRLFGAVGNGTTNDTAAIQSAINDAAAVDGYVHFSAGHYRVTNITFPSDIIVSFAPGAMLTIDSGNVVTINCYQIIAPFQTIFEGYGSVGYMPNIPGVYAEWWGAAIDDSTNDAYAITAALNSCNNLYLINGHYNISTTVTIPTARTITINGMGYKNTFFTLASSANFHAFEFVSSTATTSDVTFSYCAVEELGYARNSTFLYFHGASSSYVNNHLTMECMITFGTKRFVDLGYANLSHFESLYGAYNEYLFNITAGASNITILDSLGVSNGGMIIGNGENVSSNMALKNTHSVWCYGIDVNLSNYTNFVATQGGFDLGYVDTVLTTGQTNDAAFNFYNVTNFRLEGLWIASNGGLSKTVGGNVLEAVNRIGVQLNACNNGVIRGCTITNHKYGIRAVNSPVNTTSAQMILIYGNTFLGDTAYDLVFLSSKYIWHEMNFHNQYPSDYNICEVIGNNCTYIYFVGNSFRRQINSNAALLNMFSDSSNIILDSNFYNVN